MSIPAWSDHVTDLRPIIEVLGGHAGEVGLYCQNGACAVREFSITVKPYGEDIPERPCCPFCRSDKDVLFSFVRTGEEGHKHSLEEALQRIALEKARRNGVVSIGDLFEEVDVLRKSLNLREPQS